MRRVALRASLRYFCARKFTTALLSSQSSCARNLFASLASDAVLVKNGLTGTSMSTSLPTQFQRSLSTHSGRNSVDEIFEAFLAMNGTAEALEKNRVDEIVEAFLATNGTAEALEVMKDLESCGANDLAIGVACLKITFYMLLNKEKDPEKALTFCTRAFKIFSVQSEVGRTEEALHLAGTLLCMGILHSRIGRIHESIGCLDRANHVLDAIGNIDGPWGICGKHFKHSVELKLAKIKSEIGRTEEALQHMRRSFESSIYEPNSLQDGEIHSELAKAYAAASDFNKALPLGLKALKIFDSHLGSNSVKSALGRKLVSNIYCGLGEYQKSLEEVELAKKVLKILRRDLDLLYIEIDVANIQIAQQKFDEAIKIFESVVQKIDDNQARAYIFIEMAKAFRAQEKFVDSKRCLDISCSIFDTIEISSPIAAGKGYLYIAVQYENLNEIDSAISLYKKLLSLTEKLPKELQCVEGAEGFFSASIGTLLMVSGKTSQAVPYLESSAKKMKESLGEKYCMLGFVYKYLGAAHLKLECPESAAQMSFLAKDILDGALGPHHPESIEACQNLANAYSAMSRYGLAIKFQQRVVEGWESHGPAAEEKLREAQLFLEKIKSKQQLTPTDSIQPLCDLSFFK